MTPGRPRLWAVEQARLIMGASRDVEPILAVASIDPSRAAPAAP